MTGICTLVDLLLFYTLERVLFNRMVGSMGKNPQQVKRAMALWLMLEEIGYHELIRMIHSYDKNTIEALFNEALQCLEFIQPNAAAPTTGPADGNDTPAFLGLFDDPMSFRFFYYNREFMYKRYVHIMETVCDKIFGENAAIEVDESGMKPVAKPLGEGSNSTSESNLQALPEQGGGHEASKLSNLNPGANEFRPGQSTPEDTRTMFLTFSKGHPLSREEIVHFFTSNWGEVVQELVIEQAQTGQEPQFGRIVFTSSLVIPKVLNGQAKAKFLVNRKHLWARIYVPRHRGRRS